MPTWIAKPVTLHPPPTPEAREKAVAALGLDLWERMRGERLGLFDRGFWQGKMLDFAMRDPGFRVDLFRFVEVMPALRGKREILAHLRGYLLRPDRTLPTALSTALQAASGGLAGAFTVEAVRRNIVSMASGFIAGETPREALKPLRALHKQGLGFTCDLLGEATLTASEGEEYAERYRTLIDVLAAETRGWEEKPELLRCPFGPLPLAQVSLKLSALDPALSPVDMDGAVHRLFARLRPICLAAREKNVAVMIDRESWSLHEIAARVFEKLALDEALRDWPHLGLVVQAYLHAAPADLERLYALVQKRGTPVHVRLVKGAYWDYETALAQQRGYPCPVIQGKEAVDAQYESLSRRLIDGIDHWLPAFGSHNLRSLAQALAYAEARGAPQDGYEAQMLFGMAEPERQALRARGVRVRVYAPVGALLPGMAYLVRRLLENTSNTGFLRQTHHDNTDPGELLRAPRVGALGDATGAPGSGGAETATHPQRDTGNAKVTQASQPRKLANDLTPPAMEFRNCPLIDFADAEARAAFAGAVAKARALPVQDVPLSVDGQTRFRPADFSWPAPADGRRLARITLATASEAAWAVESAARAYPAWRDTPLRERTGLLLRLAELLEAKRLDLAAWQTLETAKPWAEADADVAEAVDFCRYYALRAPEELGEAALPSPGGESNTWHWQGRGVCAVIAPWNFPLAILTGMAAAALVAGNAVVLKPAEQSSVMAYRLYEALREAGFPEGTVQFLPGSGETAGASLVRHAQVANVAFTGSLAVGRTILKETSELQPGQMAFKRVVCELGGKNAIVVDEDADLDEAVAGVARSAFGYAGQKCSAASRLFLVGSVAEPFLERLIGHARCLRPAPADDPSCDLPPLIDADAAARLRALHRDPGAGARLVWMGEAPAAATADGSSAPQGNFVPAAVYEVESPRHRLMQDEFFGPLLAVMRVPDFDAALNAVAATPYALTGAVYSRLPAHLEKAKREFRVGNLYLNRPSTGALVGRQPFGGFGHSGLGTKAGGPGYLRNFADPRAVCENTMRHGFAPEVST